MKGGISRAPFRRNLTLRGMGDLMPEERGDSMDASGWGSDVVVATYREIADHYGLKGPDQGRVKAKRAGWPAEPQNHPADPIRAGRPNRAKTYGSVLHAMLRVGLLRGLGCS